ncbi:MAG: PAS domain S-box protein [Acidobacteria bacterium]|nr:PAS domain S-box protein [Acidobacteriota bacterium]MBV9069351.1 PAS domain S-box protein [Acidobacteriota bacterium]MBV9187157.1 PAS domain S-box protein [Acidobacteriota bacterium]
MMDRRGLSVAVVVAATLVTVTTFLFGVLAAVGYVSEHRTEEERLRRGVAAQAEELAAALALPVWNIDRAQIDRILDSQGQTPQVEAVVVEAAGKIQARVRYQNGRFVASNGNVSPAGLFVAERPITFSGERIGSVRLFATPRYIEQQLRSSLISMAGTTLAIDLLLILSVYLVLWRAVVRPLTDIEKYAAAVSGGKSDTPVSGVFPKELASVQSSIESMVRLIEERYRELRESGERFHSIFDAVNDAIVINDIDSGAILDANPAMCAMFGYTVEELRSIGIGPLSAGDLSFTTADALERIRKAAAGEEQLFEWHSRHKDGHLFWTEVNMHVAAIGDSRRSIVVVRDITQRKQMEEALKAETDFTDTAINAMTGIFFVQTRQGRFLRWNQPLERLAAGEGRTVEELGGLILIHPDDRDLVAAKIDDVFENGYAEIEARLVLSDDVRHYLLNGRRMDVGGEQFLVGTGFDVTERRRAEAEQKRLQSAVERSAAEWKETFDAVTTPILIMESSGAVVRVNRAALELSGLSQSDIAGRPIDQIGDGEPWHTASQLVSYIAGKREGTTAETKDAEGRTWDIIITHFSAANGGAERFILVLWEITGIVELQESLRRSETLSAMGTLVAGVAHEVRNPLFGISATLDAFDEEMKQPGYAECGATLRQEVNRLVHLMQELLEYGKPAALSIERGDLNEVVGDAVESRSAAARAAQVEIRNAMTATLPTLLMDPLRLRQVFENLIDNAVQHSDPGMTVHIGGAVVDHAGRQWVECRIDDEGPGFAPQDFDRVFEPFFSQREGGTGLGLSIVQRIVEEHSGKVIAANRHEGGGSIRVLFPLGGAQ